MEKYRHLRMICLPGLLLLVFFAACSKNGGPTSSSTSGSQASLVGTWTGCAFLEFNGAEFHADGTADLDKYVVKYTFDGTHVEFSSLPQEFINTATKYASLLSSDGNLLTLTDTQGNFCVLVRSGSSDEQKLLSSIIGAWTGDCSAYTDQENVSFSHIRFGADGTLTWDGSLPGDTGNSKGTYIIPAAVQSVSDDYSLVNLQFVDNVPIVFAWKVSADGKTLTLAQYGLNGQHCSLAHS